MQRYGAPQTITLRVFNQQGSLLATSDPNLDIIEAHQGSIIASSTPNQGATFTIYLPIIRNS
ncbi:hypothetical protein [Nostoc commune]|uniref:hypothetical protein n=1 Tax=Nostoc commune TaxID=1178 RepID=UPI00207433D8|nr:hypothetical protein [Nostoc commune]